jgi:hypothetical protein
MENTEKSLVSVGLKPAVKAGIFTNISEVRVNTNGYPYVTFRGNNKGTNVYFSRTTADEFVEGQVLTAADVVALRLGITVTETGDNKGEKRLKLFFAGEGSGTNMEDIFDDVITPEQKVVLRMLATEMTAKPKVEPEEEKTPQRAPQRTE